MRFSSTVRLGRMNLVAAAVASVTFACSTPAVLDGSTRTDASDVTSADRGSTGDGATTDAPTTDTPAAIDVVQPSDVPASMDVSTPPDATTTDDVPTMLDTPIATDTPPSTDVSSVLDVTTTRDAGGACTLPLGGTCDRGTTCPAGDGCNTCMCPLVGPPICTRRFCADAGNVDVPTTGGECRADSDCRLYSSYCASAPCQCFALSPTDMMPRCSGGMVTCFIDPCARRTASCVGGSCVVTP